MKIIAYDSFKPGVTMKTIKSDVREKFAQCLVARHAAGLGFIPVIVAYACGAGEAGAAKRSLESLAFAGDSLITDTAAFCSLLSVRPRRSS